MDPIAKKISLDNGWELYYDKCLIATGGQPNNLPVFAEGSDEMKKRVSVYRTVSEFLSSSATNTQFFQLFLFPVPLYTPSRYLITRHLTK